MPGVFAHGTFDTWSPGYLMFIAATHNGISRLYETFGNGGTADTQERILGANETSRTWYRQNPPLPRVNWSLRNNNNYEQTGLLVSLSYIANNRHQFLENFYEKSKRSILKAKTEGPAAYILHGQRSRARARRRSCCAFCRSSASRSRAPRRRSPSRCRSRSSRRGAAAEAAGVVVAAPRRRRPTPAADGRRATAGRSRRPRRASFRRAATSSAWTSRTRASPTRCSTISSGRRTIRRRRRTTTPAGRSPKASPSRPCA